MTPRAAADADRTPGDSSGDRDLRCPDDGWNRQLTACLKSRPRRDFWFALCRGFRGDTGGIWSTDREVDYVALPDDDSRGDWIRRT